MTTAFIKPIVTHKRLDVDHDTRFPLIPTHETFNHKTCGIPQTRGKGALVFQVGYHPRNS